MVPLIGEGERPLERLLEAARERWHLQFHFHPTFPSSPRISVNASILLGYTEAIRQRLHGFGCWSQPAYGFPGILPSAIVHAAPEFICG